MIKRIFFLTCFTAFFSVTFTHAQFSLEGLEDALSDALGDAAEDATEQLGQLDEMNRQALERYNEAMENYDFSAIEEALEERRELIESGELERQWSDTSTNGFILELGGVAAGTEAAVRPIVGAGSQGHRDTPGLQLFDVDFMPNGNLVASGFWKYDVTAGGQYIMLSESEAQREALATTFADPTDVTPGRIVQRYDYEGPTQVEELLVTEDGSRYAAVLTIRDEMELYGTTIENEGGVWLIKMAPSGRVLWHRNIAPETWLPHTVLAEGQDGVIYLLASDRDRSYRKQGEAPYLSTSTRAVGTSRFVLAAVAPDGTPRFSRSFETVDGYDIAPAKGGGVILGGSYWGGEPPFEGLSADVPHEQAFIASIAPDGSARFAQGIGPILGSNAIRAVYVDDAGAIYATGTTSEYTGSDETLLAKFTRNGNLVWMREYGDNKLLGTNVGTDVITTDRYVYTLEWGYRTGGISIVQFSKEGEELEQFATLAFLIVVREPVYLGEFIEHPAGGTYVFVLGDNELDLLGQTFTTVNDDTRQVGLFRLP